MSVRDRLEKKTAALVGNAVPAQGEVSTRQGKVDSRVPRTGPGQMLAFRSHLQESTGRIQDLEAQLAHFEGSIPAKKLDPNSICSSKWANRHASSFKNAEFHALKREIEAGGGNVQPILVRPVTTAGDRFEIVFGHRRHQACLELGLPVLALIEEVSDKELFALMDRENRSRSDLSPYEQGEMYRKAIDDGLFTSLRMMASELGVDPGNVSKAVSIARFPADVLNAFDSPSHIQYRWGALIAKALANDPEGVLKRAKSLAALEKKPSANEILDTLTGQVRKLRASTIDLRKSGKSLGRIKRATDGSILISLKAGVLNEEDFLRVKASIEGIVLQ